MTGPPVDMTSLAQLFPPHSGPTILYLNFDGGSVHDDGRTDQVTPFAPFGGDSRDQDIQQILFETAQMFAPFNVEIERIFGAGNIDRSNGDTTIFIGANSADINKAGKFAAGFNPASSADTPGDNKGNDHRPNSDPFDIAFVDPVSGLKDPATWTTTSDAQAIAQGVAHEAGHTFGLVHVRTDGLQDPAQLSQGMQPDVMSYNSPNSIFADTSFQITDWNQEATGLKFETWLTPKWNKPDPDWGWLGITDDVPIYKQDSYTYLKAVLGPRDLSADPYKHVADPFRVAADYRLREGAVWNVAAGSLVRGSILQRGDDDVFTLTTSGGPSSVTVRDTPYSTLDPVLMVYDATGTNLIAFGHGSNIQISLPPNSTFKVIVAGGDGVSTGNYELFNGPLDQFPWTNLGGIDLQQVVMGNNADGRLQAFALGGDGMVYSEWQTLSGGWSGWSNFGGTQIQQIALGRNADGRLELFAVGGDHVVYTMSQTFKNEGWGAWSLLGPSHVTSVSVGTDQDGRLEFFTLMTDGTVDHLWQDTPSGSWDRSVYRLGYVTDPPVGSIAWSIQHFGIRQIELGNRADGRIEVFVVGNDYQLYTMTQSSPNGGKAHNDWTTWTTPGPYRADLSQIAVGQNLDGRLQLFALAGDRSVYTIAETAPNGYWSYDIPWTSLGGSAIASISVGTGPDGRLWLVAIGSDNRVYDQSEIAPNGPFSQAWKTLGGIVSQIALANEADRSLDVFGLSYDTGTLYYWGVATRPRKIVLHPF
jgi:hypothetical protein